MKNKFKLIPVIVEFPAGAGQPYDCGGSAKVSQASADWAEIEKAKQMQWILMLTLGSAALLTACATTPHARPSDVVIRRSDGTTIDFYLNSASEADRADLLLVALKGSDCNTVFNDEYINEHIGGIFGSADILTVEKIGLSADLPYNLDPERPDCPERYLQNDNPHQRVQDMQAVVSRLQHRYRHIAVIGGSEGATVAGLFGAESGLADAVIMINGGGRWFVEDVRHSIRATTAPETLESELESFNSFARHILASDPFPMQVSNHGYGWWRSMLTIDQEAVLRKIEVPVLLVQGGRDKSVSPAAAMAMASKLRRQGKANIELAAYPELDHGLSTSAGVNQAQKVLNDAYRWLQSGLDPGDNPP